MLKIEIHIDHYSVFSQSEELCRMYLDCAPEHTNDEDVTSGSVDCADNTLQCEVDEILLQ